jgi:NADH dehydrogenase/NADH:ubiquinone oxidoreductase subunit G
MVGAETRLLGTTPRETVRRRLKELLRPGELGLAVASAFPSLEELFLFRRLAARLAKGAGPVGGLARAAMDEGDDLLLSADRTPNRRALEWLEMRELSGAELGARLAGTAGKTVLVYGGDPAADPAVAKALAGSERLVYLGTHENATSRAAALVVPTSIWAEKDGLFVNRQGRIQSFCRAVAPPEGVEEDMWLLVDLLRAAGEEDAPRELREWRRILGAELGWNGAHLGRIPDTGLVPARANALAGGGG